MFLLYHQSLLELLVTSIHHKILLDSIHKAISINERNILLSSLYVLHGQTSASHFCSTELSEIQMELIQRGRYFASSA
jgi:hypothetical protein